MTERDVATVLSKLVALREQGRRPGDHRLRPVVRRLSEVFADALLMGDELRLGFVTIYTTCDADGVRQLAIRPSAAFEYRLRTTPLNEGQQGEALVGWPDGDGAGEED